MKYTIAFLLIAVSLTSFAQSEEEAVKQVIQTAYIDGIQNGGSVDDIREGFHPTFTMLRNMENTIKPLGIEEWITNIEKSKKENTAPAPPKAEGKFLNVDVTGTAAVVKLELYRGGKKVFTDYLVLSKFTDGWKIVSKSFYRHP